MARTIVRPLTAMQFRILAMVYPEPAPVSARRIMEKMLCQDLARVERSIDTLVPAYLVLDADDATGAPTHRLTTLGATVVANLLNLHQELTKRAYV